MKRLSIDGCVITVQGGPTIEYNYTNLIIDCDTWLCYCALLDCFNSGYDSRAFVLVNIDGSTKIVQIHSGSALSSFGNKETYERLKTAGYRWIYLFDCLLTLVKSIPYNNDAIEYGLLHKYLPQAHNKNGYIFNGLSKKVVEEGTLSGVFEYLGKERISVARSSNIYDKYKISNLSTDLPEGVDFHCLDDCLYSIDSANIISDVSWLHCMITGNSLTTYYYLRSE